MNPRSMRRLANAMQAVAAAVILLGSAAAIAQISLATRAIVDGQDTAASTLEEIKFRIAADPYLNADNLSVAFTNGVVTLNGLVGTLFEKTRITSTVWIPGVKFVNSDGLRVAPDLLAQRQLERGRPGEVIREAAGARRDRTRRQDETASRPASRDERLLQLVAINLLYDSRITRPLPDVEVVDGVVTLSGGVESLRAKWAAEEIVRFTPGVKWVRNQLSVAPAVPVTDTGIAKEIAALIRHDADLHPYQIMVRVRNGVVHLSGDVDALHERRKADTIAARTRGVVAVDNNIAIPRDRTPEAATWPFLLSELPAEAERPSDDQLALEVRNRLAASSIVNEANITVAVEDRVVTLRGVARTDVERETAEQNAYLAGARAVVNEIEVK